MTGPILWTTCCMIQIYCIDFNDYIHSDIQMNMYQVNIKYTDEAKKHNSDIVEEYMIAGAIMLRLMKPASVVLINLLC